MSIYIIRPKTNIVGQSLNLIAKKFTPENRQKQMEEITTVYKDSPIYQEMIQWTEEIQGKETIKVIKNPSEPGVTGAAIIKMSEEEATQTRHEFPEFYVLKDQSIELIHPHKVTASYKKEEQLIQDDLWHLQAINSQQQLNASGKGVTVAVLDTGIDSSHPALRGKVAQAYEFKIEHGQAIELANSLDTEGHGTHVAGLICGHKIGVAPEATVINGLMIPKGRGKLSNFIVALDWVANQAAIQIVNVSAGLYGYFSGMDTVIEDLLAVGVLPVCAVGNKGRIITCSPGNYCSVVSVGATNKDNKVASFSSSGKIEVNYHQYTVPHIVAPGEQVYSCVVQGGYEAWNGTSMATPIVSGVAALILERYPDITVTDLREELINRCKDLGQPRERQGYGLIQI
ncbi:peptidase S8 and S53 subtilisin kexin sedolisin [Gloeothece citriformis PCC 7424]|uniref:Peptidase S8 and S53 subtilisin kexin sedolisin n=1 Tax=Gloeothece citriformis (strain PCC 7424) TaxID=65393 RepID=B7KJJ6_GLOC7|nr:S8 family serine peptidase [Gloeothece citriformis]ACK73673.1 peptidase S8 and S53 subtilisin kexin sedolisin [Gloeothece citriformis PCC 7424]